MRTHEAAEWTLDLPGSFDNPFDPAVIAVDVTFTKAKADPVTVPAFWDGVADEATTQFRVRFAPPAAGTWTARWHARSVGAWKGGEAVDFDVVEGDSRGFIGVAGNGRYFAFDDGSTYFPIGANIAWPATEDHLRVSVYSDYFAKLAGGGGNAARLWMGNRKMMIEPEVAGRYDLETARAFDGILDDAQTQGIGVFLCLMNYREFVDRDAWGPANWPPHPYNSANGGPAKTSADFFTNNEARRLFKARLRYLVARYGAFTSVACWELINEQEFAKVGGLEDWNNEMMGYLADIDPYDHLISTSAKVPAAVNAQETMSFTQAHLYGGGSQPQMADAIVDAVQNHAQYDKPHLISEIGLNGRSSDVNYDPTGIGTPLHNAAWAAAISGSAGSAFNWWWEDYINTLDLWDTYASLSTFAATIDWAGRDYRPIDVLDAYQADIDASRLGDAEVAAVRNWSAMDPTPIRLLPNGTASSAVPRYLIGAENEELHAPLSFDINLPRAGQVIARFNGVSDFAVVRLLVDDEPVSDIMLSGLPGGPGVSNAKLSDEGMYQSDIDVAATFDLPAGQHVITLDTVGGDWAKLTSLIFTNAVEQRRADLSTYALRDEATGDTVLWLLDRTSNHLTDARAEVHRELDDVRLIVPIASGHVPYRVTWWDTRSGSHTSQDVKAEGAELLLDVPAFSRDIAIRITPVESTP